MGPYCNYCNQRCFTHMPMDTPAEALAAYGTSRIIATCPAGQQFELEKTGWNYERIMKAIADATPLANTVRKLHALQLKRKEMLEVHQNAIANVDGEMDRLRAEYKMLCAGLDLKKIELAKKVIGIRGKFTRGGDDRHGVVNDAILDLAEKGGATLATKFFGTKEYDRWYGQRCDCEYGYGPKHGSIIFAIELMPEFRVIVASGAAIAPAEIEAAIYYLSNLEQIEKSQADALVQS